MPGDNVIITEAAFQTLHDFEKMRKALKLLNKIQKKSEKLLSLAKGNAESIEYRKGDFLARFHRECTAAIRAFNERFSRFSGDSDEYLHCASMLLKVELYLLAMHFDSNIAVKCRTKAGAVRALYRCTLFVAQECATQFIRGQHRTKFEREDGFDSRLTESKDLLIKFKHIVEPDASYMEDIQLTLLMAVYALKNMALPLSDAILASDTKISPPGADNLTPLEMHFLSKLSPSCKLGIPQEWRVAMLQFSRWYCQQQDNQAWLIIPLSQEQCFKIDLRRLSPLDMRFIHRPYLLFIPALKAILMQVLDVENAFDPEPSHTASSSASSSCAP